MPRCTLLFIIEGRKLRDAVGDSLRLAHEYQEHHPSAMEITRSEPYAVGEAGRIQQNTKLPRTLADTSSAATGAGAIHAIWSGGRWIHPGDCPPGPPDLNGATQWQWAHYNAVMDADRSAHFILWDLYLRPAQWRDAA